MKTKKMIPVSFSADQVLNITLPRCWADLTQPQLRYVFYALANFEALTAKVYIFSRLCGLILLRRAATGWLFVEAGTSGVRRQYFLHTWQVQEILRKLDFLVDPNFYPVRLDKIKDYVAVDRELHGVPFEEYLICENLYQGFLATNRVDVLQNLAVRLYRRPDGSMDEKMTLEPWQLQSVFLWYQAVKMRFSNVFSEFFKNIDGTVTGVQPDMMAVMNAEIRALTGGDVTKERDVLQLDCWRALTELNEKAREAREWREKYGRH